MTIQWTFIAGFMYAEIALIVILLLPFISAYRWQKIFRSTLINKLAGYSTIYFNVFIVILLILFFDAIREVNKFAGPTADVDLKNNPDQQNFAHMKLFRAQRNLYIAGFALFMWFIIRRLVTLISQQAQLEANFEASQKQAKSASDAAKKMMEEKENLSNLARSDDTDIDAVKREKDLAQELDEVKETLKETQSELKTKEKDFEALKNQAEGTNKEYDRLLNEYSALESFLLDMSKPGLVWERVKTKEKDFEAQKNQAEGTNKEYDRLLNEYSALEKKLMKLEGEGEGKKIN